MRRYLGLGAVSVVFVSLLVAGSDFETWVEQGLSIFLNDQVVVESRDELEAAITSLLSAYALDSAHAEVLNALSQCYYTLADVYETADSAKKAQYVEGQRYGEESLRLAPGFVDAEKKDGFMAGLELVDDVAALQWTYSNWSRKDEFDILGAVFRNDPPKLRALVERALEVDPLYVAGAPYRSLAALNSSLPKLLGQDLETARGLLCHVVDAPESCGDCGECPVDLICREFFGNRVFYVKYYLVKVEKWAEAKVVLESVLAEDPGMIYPFHNALNQERARQMLDDEVLPHLP
jgi:hypothetical protein